MDQASAPPSLQGPETMINYLKELDNKYFDSLVEKFAPLCFKSNAKETFEQVRVLNIIYFIFGYWIKYTYTVLVLSIKLLVCFTADLNVFDYLLLKMTC